ncbi:unnamed protein product [Thelazia callipaeda]|uniref:PX domain-containing protein n=1 Tax=Thelazia callipaeda TaxID=103827 RepID=A0A0N5CPS2_THECL|nr:unnamed protein product [Thelazia callipaeda]
MIHIAIPSTQTLVEADGRQKYDAFDIYVNDAYHASVRYSHLLKLHEKLHDYFGQKLKTPDFPSKKLFRSLDEKALNERRIALARYFQAVVQLQQIAQHFITENAFLNFQIESFRPSSSNVSVDIFMADGTKETVRCNVEHPTEIVLKRFASNIGLCVENIGNFGLFVAKRRYGIDDGRFMPSFSTSYPDLLCIRLLRNFESPYLSVHLLNQKSAAVGVFYFIVIKKLIWDPRVEEELMDDPGAVLLLYKQAVSDLHNGHFVPRQLEIKDRLLSLEEQGNCLQFLRLCRLEPNYGYEVLMPCISDYPRHRTECSLKVGRRHILLEFKNDENKISRAEFRATRIRVWRISQQDNGDFMFLFEYLMSSGEFQWIALRTNQAILLSLLLQSIGFEILQEHRSFLTGFDDGDTAKNAFKICSPQDISKNVCPVVSLSSKVSEKNADKNDTIPQVGCESNVITNNNCVEDAGSDSGSVQSLETIGLNIHKTHSESVVTDLTEDVFITISKELPLRHEIFEITDDDL